MSEYLQETGEWDYFVTLRYGSFSSVHGLVSKINQFWDDNQIQRLFFSMEKDDQVNNHHCHVLIGCGNLKWGELERSCLKGTVEYCKPVRSQIGSTMYVSKYVGTHRCPEWDLRTRE